MPRWWSLLAAAALACGPATRDPEPPVGLPGTELWDEPRGHAGYDPRDHVRLSRIDDHPWDGDDYGSAHLRDIMIHTPPGSRWHHDDAQLPTIAHETHHGLQAARARTTGHPAHFFYFERGLGAHVPMPRSSLRLIRRDGDTPVYTEDAHTASPDVRARIPAAARTIASLRYETYLLPAEREHYGVLTLFNEWNAYVAGGRVAIELWRGGRYYAESRPGFRESSNVRRLGELDGMVDFLYFASAGVAALMDKEPEYMSGNEQLRAVFAALAEQTMLWHRRGQRIPIFTGFHGPELLDHFLLSPENARIRETLRDWLGPEWTMHTLGF